MLYSRSDIFWTSVSVCHLSFFGCLSFNFNWKLYKPCQLARVLKIDCAPIYMICSLAIMIFSL